jgi:peptidoglycan/LPS O-acetylase OafA/YrhL
VTPAVGPAPGAAASASPGKIAVINGLRGVAIAGVIFHHAYFRFLRYGQDDPDALLRLAKSVPSSGWLGVNLFFMLSGFVLCWPYARGSRSIAGPGDVGGFYLRRAARLLPLYWFICLVSLALYTDFRLEDPRLAGWLAALATATFQFSSATFMPAPNWVLWSLAVEICFSLAFPFLLLAFRRHGWRRPLAAIVLVSLATRVTGHVVLYAAPHGGILNAISDSALGRLDEFALGMFLAHLVANGHAPGTFSGRRALLGLGGIAAAMCLWGAWYRMEIPAASAALISWPLDLGMFFVIGHLVTRPAGAPSLARRIASAWPLQMLGLMCYSLYVWHGILMQRLFPDFREDAAQFAAYFATLLLCSALTYRFIEFGNVKSIRGLLPARGPGDAGVAVPRA